MAIFKQLYNNMIKSRTKKAQWEIAQLLQSTEYRNDTVYGVHKMLYGDK